MDGRRRVVITGLGAISPLGANLSEYWEGLSNGRSGIRRITQFDASDMPCQIGGEIPNFVPENYMDRKEARRVPRCCQITLAAAIEAMKDAGFDSQAPDPERAGVFFGTAIGGVDKLEEGAQRLRTSGHSKVSPFMLPTGIPNIPAFMIAEHFQMLGPNATISTACATGTQAIGGAAEYIRHGSADLVITGGVEALMMDWAIGGFCAMRALPLNFNDNPTEASRPFDANREGFVFSEGCGVLVLEELEHAQKRGARIYAEIAGHASSSDAFHFAAPDPEGRGPIRAMRWALQDARPAAGSGGLHQRPRHLHPVERPDGDQSDQGGLWRARLQAGGQLDQVDDRASDGRGGRAGSDCLHPDYLEQADPTDDQLHHSGPGMRPGLRAEPGAPGGCEGNAVKLVWIGRAKRLPGAQELYPLI